MIAYDQPFPFRKEAKTLIVPAVLWGLLAGGYCLAVLILTPWVRELLLGPFNSPIVVGTAAFQIVAASALLATICLYRALNGKALSVGIIGGTQKDFTIAGVGAVALVLGFQAWVQLSGVGNPPWAVAYVVESGDSLPLVLLTSGVVAPVFEEVLFRGVLLYAFLKIFLVCNLHRLLAPGVVCAIAVFTTSVLFALFHGSQYELDALVYMFILGCWYGYLAVRVRSLAVPMFAHSVTGLVTIAILLAAG